MPKFTAREWDEVRRKFRSSIMADTSLVSLAQNLDTKEWPHRGEEETPAKYIDFTYDELLILPEIAGKAERADHLISILKETLAFDDPFGEMVAQVEESAARENPILKTLSRLGLPEAFPLSLVNLSEGTRAVCASEGVKTLGEFANLAQQMATRVVIGGDFRALLNALTHGDEEGIARFLPSRRGVPGVHLPEALGLLTGGLTRAEQLALAAAWGLALPAGEKAEPLTSETRKRRETDLRAGATAVFEWFAAEKDAWAGDLRAGGQLSRRLVVIGDPLREALAARLVRDVLAPAAGPAEAPVRKKAGFFARLFGRGGSSDE